MAFRDIIGQDRAVNILLKTIQRERIPSSYLFAGESGIGKKLTAVNLAKALNCLTREQGGSTRPELQDNGLRLASYDCCDACPSCRKIESGIHPDVMTLAPEGGQIRIEEIRAIDEVLSLTAFEGKYKIVIVDDADSMNSYAANAFLKTLEEPPDNSLILLISANPDKLPDTIRSRCSRINFAPLSHEACRTVIENMLVRKSESSIHRKNKKERVKKKKSEEEMGEIAPLPDSPALSLLARLSMGRPGIAASGDLIEEREWFLKLLTDMLNAEKDGWTSRDDMERWFDFLIIILRDMAVMKITGDEMSLINCDMKEYIKKLSNSVELTDIIKDYQIFNLLKGYFIFHVNKSLTWNYTGSVLRKTMVDFYA